MVDAISKVLPSAGDHCANLGKPGITCPEEGTDEGTTMVDHSTGVGRERSRTSSRHAPRPRDEPALLRSRAVASRLREEMMAMCRWTRPRRGAQASSLRR